MTTKLLRQIHEQDQADLAARYNGDDTKQPRRKWCVVELKAELTEQEYAAGVRAVDECWPLYKGRDADFAAYGFQIYRDGDTGLLTSGKEQSELKRAGAAYALTGLRQGVSKRCDHPRSAHCAEWIVQLHTLQDVAMAMGWLRSKGADRPQEPDMRRTRPFVRLVLLAMAGYYADCDLGRDRWVR